LIRRRRYRLRLDGLEDRSLPSFVAGTSFPVGPNGGSGSQPVSIVTGDFNGDGVMDIATANQDHNYISVLLGNGNGGFQSSNDIGIGVTPVAIAKGDFNNDGILDLATANKSNNSVTILLGVGDGTFTVGDTISIGNTAPVGVVVADFNSDGFLDLATANISSGTTTLLTGNGTGHFTYAGQFTVGNNPTSIAVGDFNGDGLPDIVTDSGAFGQVNLNMNIGIGGFGPPVAYSTGSLSNSVVVGDFNGDGHPDVAVGCKFGSGDGVNVLLGKAGGTLQPFVHYDAGHQNPVSLVVGDLNGDGHQDLITANGQFANNSVSYLPGKGDGTFGPASVFTAGQGPVAVAVGDFNGDGRQDIVTADDGGSIGTVTLLKGNGDGTVKAAPSLAVNQPGPVISGDFNGDGKIDLAAVAGGVSGGGYQGAMVFLGLGDGSFGAAIPTPSLFNTQAIASGDFNGDGKQDLVVGTMSQIAVLLGNGDGTFALPQMTNIGEAANWIVTGDFNGDGKTDVAIATNSGTGITILLGKGDGSFGAPLPVNAGGAATYVATGDLNGDGTADLAVVLGSANKVSVLLGKGDGSFGAPETHNTEVQPNSVTIGDLNGDGKLDFFVPSYIGPPVSSTFQVFLNDGTGHFTAGNEYNTDSNPIGSALIDYNGDGIPDVVTVNNFADTVCVFTGNGDGTFNDPKRYVVGDRPNWVAATDFNGDGRPDLAVVNSNSNTVTLLSSLLPANHLDVKIAPSPIIAGGTVHLTVTAKEPNGDVASDYLGQVSFSSDNPADVLPSPYQFAELDAGSHTFDFNLTVAGHHKITVTTTFGSYSTSVDVTPAAADHFEFDSPTTAIAGSPFNVTVKVFDPYGNLAAGYTGTAHFVSNDPNGGISLPGNYTFSAGDAGQHTFAGGVRLLTAGPRSLSASLTSLSTINNTLTVIPAAASMLTVTGPASATAGTSINVIVTALDPYGNRATGFLGTVHFNSTDPSAVLPGDYTFQPTDLGIKGLPVTFKKSGQQSVSVFSPGLIGSQTGNMQVSPSNPVKYAFIQSPTDTFPNVAMKSPISVQIEDTYDNPVASIQSVTLSLSSNPTVSKLKNAIAMTDATGLAVFPKLTLNKIGQGYKLEATGASGMSAPSNPFDLYAATHFKLTVTSNMTTAGTTFNVTVAALDRFNKPDPTYRGTVHFSTNGLFDNLPADYTFTATDAGQHTFSVGMNSAGTKKLIVNDMLKPKMKQTLVMTVSATDASAFRVTGVKTSAIVNVAYSLVVTAVDKYGNTATNYAGTVIFSTNGSAMLGRAELPTTYTFLTGNKGRHSFKVSFTKPGTGLWLKVTDQNNGSITGLETGITVGGRLA
jgi:hypothetical protein